MYAIGRVLQHFGYVLSWDDRENRNDSDGSRDVRGSASFAGRPRPAPVPVCEAAVTRTGFLLVPSRPPGSSLVSSLSRRMFRQYVLMFAQRPVEGIGGCPEQMTRYLCFFSFLNLFSSPQRTPWSPESARAVPSFHGTCHGFLFMQRSHTIIKHCGLHRCT